MKKMRIMLMVAVLTITSFTFQFLSQNVPEAHAFSQQTIQRGATGSDVIELQARLQYNGYYHGTIDGVYGWSTYWAVRNFQNMFGLEEVDGLVGQKTKDMLVKSTKFYKDFVYEQINKGRRFTHYGGVPLSIQSAPSEQQIQKARQAAEQRKQQQEKNYKAQGNQQQQAQQKQAQQNKQQEQQKQAQQNKQQQEQQNQKQQNQQQQQEQQNQEQQNQQQQQEQQNQKQQNQQQQQEQQNQKQQNQQQQQEQQNQEQQNQQQQQEQQNQEQQNQNEQNENNQKDSTAVNIPAGFSQNDIKLMANAVYGEARGEPYIGQVAVAAVIVNRLNSATFPNTVSGVIFEPRAFTAVADGQIWLTPNDSAKKAVLDALNGFDPTGEALYYFNPDTATSSWIWGRPQIKRIGKHIFCE
ncbi:N-acetylmuramoyl-L-alanine amidase [Metabacillus crassostreae]|uniref:spore cortex-lytic enzyme n=1 Tax=Metabacillus crassostreae TaxID=929098 RepID=UPI00195BADD5|nr:spore cortex-lytic enzyme [Metabacillus crassostreae]MBM7604451.1 N-acetylmuramoyl-L-alanine amidase [Metabacillus crassostreae]